MLMVDYHALLQCSTRTMLLLSSADKGTTTLIDIFNFRSTVFLPLKIVTQTLFSQSLSKQNF